jgi:hypothetical protein
MQSFSIPNPPDTLSFDALMAIYVGRIVDTMRVPLDTMYGVQAFVQAYHDGMGLDLRANLDEWAADWADSIPAWRHWLAHISSDPMQTSTSTTPLSQSVNPEIRFREAIKEYGALDAVSLLSTETGQFPHSTDEISLHRSALHSRRTSFLTTSTRSTGSCTAASGAPCRSCVCRDCSKCGSGTGRARCSTG